MNCFSSIGCSSGSFGSTMGESLSKMWAKSPEKVILYGLIGYVTLDSIWELYLTYRQVRVLQTTCKAPLSIRHIFNEQVFLNSRNQALDSASYKTWNTLYSTLVAAIAIYRRSISNLWDFSQELSFDIGFAPHSLYGASICFTLANSLLSMIVSLPMVWYYMFAVEQRRGRNQTIGAFLQSYIKDNLHMAIYSVPVTVLIVYIFNNGGKNIHLWLWSITFLTKVFMQFIFPTFIVPVVSSLTPLPSGPLQASIQQLANCIGFPLDGVFVVDGSTRSGYENAFFTGLVGPKSIVLYDNLLAEEDGDLIYEDEEILAIICHELGHWKTGDQYYIFALTEISRLFSFLVFNMMLHYAPLYRAFGFPWGVEPTIIGFIIIRQFILAPYNSIMGFLFSFIKRRFEFQADEFVVKMRQGRALKVALLKLHQNNLTFPVDDWLHSVWRTDHPTLLERIEYIDKFR